MLACANHTAVWLAWCVIVYFVVSGIRLLKLRFHWQHMNAEHNDKNFWLPVDHFPNRLPVLNPITGFPIAVSHHYSQPLLKTHIGLQTHSRLCCSQMQMAKWRHLGTDRTSDGGRCWWSSSVFVMPKRSATVRNASGFARVQIVNKHLNNYEFTTQQVYTIWYVTVITKCSG